MTYYNTIDASYFQHVLLHIIKKTQSYVKYVYFLLHQFIEKFQEVKEAIQAQQCGGAGAKSVTNGNSGAATPVASATASPLLAGRATGADEPPPAISPAQVCNHL